jgi:hypothetical protein
MSEPNNYYDNPARQLLVNDVDLSGIAFSIQVELNENGIPMCTLVADNDDAKTFLSKMVVGDTIVVKGLAQSNEAYQVENTVNWSLVLPCFKGNIQELSPSLTQTGQQASVMSLGLGFQLKEMKVNSWYGDITALPQIANVVSFSNQIMNWSSGGYNQVPYIGCYSGESAYSGIFQFANQNYIQLDSNNLGGYIGGFGFAMDEDYDYNPFSYAKLHIVAGIYANDESQSITSATVTPYYSIDNGATWHAFAGNNGAANRGGSVTNYTGLGGNFPSTTTSVTGIFPPYEGEINWLIPITWTFDDTYNPLADYVHGPPQGEDDWIDVTADLNAAGGFYHNMQIKLEFSACGNQTTGSGVSIVYMYLEYEFNAFSGLTARQLLAGDNVTKGIIPWYINKVFNGVLDTTGGSIPTGYAAIGTDYIINETPNGSNQIPSLTLPYNDAFQAINDVLRYSSGLNLLQNKVGYHWKLDTASNLLVAPVDNHHVTGVDGSHYVDAVPSTIPWVLKPYPTPIVVKQSMVTQNLKQSMPKGNMILISGRFQYPDINHDPCQGYNIDSWYPYWVDAVGGFHYTENGVVLVNNEPEIAGNCIKFPCITSPLAYYNNIWVYPLPPLDGSGNTINLLNLMGRDITAHITGLIKVTGGVVGAQIRLYWNAPNTDLIEPDTSQFMYYTLNNLTNDFFVPFDIAVPNTKFIKKFKGWAMGQDLGFLNDTFNVKHSTTHTIYDIGSVAWIAIFTGLNTGLFGPVFAELSDLEIGGTFIRGVYDSTNVDGPYTYPPVNLGTQVTYENGFGLRVITIKNSLLYTNTMNAASMTDYLTLECIFELERNEIPYTQGEITIPFDPIWLDGQQVWLQAEDVIPIGSGVYSGALNPTTSTSCLSIGNYYVNTSTWEVFVCTNIVGSDYTWTDQDTVRYKINRWFRILKVIHRFGKENATTSLQVTDDLFSSFPVNTLDSYTTIVRATNPDFQTHTNGSLKANGDFMLGLTPVITPYTPSLF